MQLRRLLDYTEMEKPGDYAVLGPGRLVLNCPVCGAPAGVGGDPQEMHPQYRPVTDVLILEPLTLPVVKCPWGPHRFKVSAGTVVKA
jgi:hypothetical protein